MQIPSIVVVTKSGIKMFWRTYSQVPAWSAPIKQVLLTL